MEAVKVYNLHLSVKAIIYFFLIVIGMDLTLMDLI